MINKDVYSAVVKLPYDKPTEITIISVSAINIDEARKKIENILPDGYFIFNIILNPSASKFFEK